MTDAKPQGKKRTSKEVLAEIKRLYAAKKYPEALKLCDLLLKKHPSNKDLHGLRQKIANKCEDQVDSPLGTAVNAQGQGPDLESTVYYTNRVEEAMGGSPETDALVEKFIKEGVGFYDVQDYDRAIECWEQALALDPDNSIAGDYIENVRNLAREQEPEPEPEDPNKPNKDQLLAIYNEGMEFFRNDDYNKALEKWEYILSFHPNHKETLQCIEKTKAAMAKREKQTVMLEEARAMIAAGKHAEAENLVNELVAQDAKLEGLDQLKEAVAERKRRINEIRSLEIEDNEDRESDYSATDDEITRYFTPESGGSSQTEGPRQVTLDLPTKKKKKPVNKGLLIGVPVTLLVLALGGWFGYKQFRSIPDDLPLPTLPREILWSSPEQKAEDFLGFADDFRDEGDYLLAAFAYQRVEEIIKPRLDDLKRVNPNVPSDELQEKHVLDKQLEDAEQGLSAAKAKIEPADKSAESAAARAEAAFRKNDYEEASKFLIKVLTLNPGDTAARELYAQAQERLGFSKLKGNELDEALQFFRRAAVLKAGYDINRRHTAVIDRFFQGKISDQEKDHWFYFFNE